MPIETRVEAARGCGYRQGGGLYLMSEGELAPCGKLPIPLNVCPVCHAGIEPSRGWTWIEAGPFLDKDCLHTDDLACMRCPLFASGLLGKVGLLWIGEKFYPRPADWLAEAKTMGISRRIPAVPKDFELGKTWVFAAHQKAITRPCLYCGAMGTVPHEPKPVETKPCPDCDGKGEIYTAAIFHAFRPTRIEYVVKGTETEEEIAELEKRGLTLVKVIRDVDQQLTIDEQKGGG